MADNGDDQPLFSSKFGVILIAMGSASFVVTMYHLIVICCQNSAEQARQNEQPATQTPSVEEGCLGSHQIPSHKYEKKKKNDENDEDDCVTCAVCLGDFEEGEELRTMPSCMHSFHVPCIDMWLISHFNCPICRADATPSPVVPRSLPEVESTETQGYRKCEINTSTTAL
ncbi:hypothetical protein TSUD_187150 [Trifolium subterraneum]|uniref:RING-type domain-containing protein n=1 Tax=Trifolium subterraneum TaxID=3900 RepID=A0A2Z6PC60_TRISU|nr:hypothetical protein TSUD_187150 [Trifolium subterraneum]